MSNIWNYILSLKECDVRQASITCSSLSLPLLMEEEEVQEDQSAELINSCKIITLKSVHKNNQ